MNKFFCLLPNLFLITACSSWDPDLVKQENEKNTFIRIEHSGCANWRKDFERLMSENIELSTAFNKAAYSCLINGTKDSHLQFKERFKKYCELEKDLSQSSHFNVQKLGHCYGKPLNAQFYSASTSLSTAMTNSIVYCSNDLQKTFESSKSTIDYLKKLEDLSKDFCSIK